ncbi:MAG: dTDP-glucose 4,6-dehydratase [Treponema sp.]|jgi:dTDP-glucose 4,6-dehydratase|nr:dTDP-glucose 4,6-dehydratase [Treponema sp.]
MRALKNILVTGGCGFIGCNFIRFLLEKRSGFTGRIINLDALTYAGNPESLGDIAGRFGGSGAAAGAASDASAGAGGSPAGGRYFFERGDICDRPLVESIFAKYDIDTVVHFAAESHVDRSILGPEAFVKTNVTGTFTLLDAARNYWRRPADGAAGSGGAGPIRRDALFHHISTDEVYGSLGETGRFTETTACDPRSPYSASKAAGDHLAMAYFHTYGLPVTLTNCSNNYGPWQFPEKLIPLSILNMIGGKPLPVYGDGKNIRDWVYVEDHNAAVWMVMQKGAAGERYNIGGENQWENIRLLESLIGIVSEKAGLDPEKVRGTVTYVKDRPGHDRRYAIDCSKIKRELGWKQTVDFAGGLRRTVDWYLANGPWVEGIRTGEYRNWIERNYGDRG